MIVIPNIIKHIIIINVLFFITTISIDHPDFNQLFNLHYFENKNFRYWQLITNIFMHGNFSHLLFNMLGLYFFGTAMIALWDEKNFLFFYFSCGIGASLIYLLQRHIEFINTMEILSNLESNTSEIVKLFSPIKVYTNKNLQTVNQIYNMQLLGASGAIFGLLTAYGLNFPNAKMFLIFFPIPIAAKYFIPIIILADLFSGITGTPILSPVNTAYFSHVGGAVIGGIIAFIWKKNQYRTY